MVCIFIWLTVTKWQLLLMSSLDLLKSVFFFSFSLSLQWDTNYMKTWYWYLGIWTSRWRSSALKELQELLRRKWKKGLWALARVWVNQVQISLDGTFSFKKVYGTQTSIYKEKMVLGEIKLFYWHFRSIRQECLWLQATKQPINK